MLLRALFAAFSLTVALVAGGLALARVMPASEPPTRTPTVVLATALPDGGVEPLDAGTSYVAFARDFAGFRTWERVGVEGAMLPIGTAPGPTSVYLNRRPPAGVRRFPVGTILVKAIENGDPAHWTVHAMVRRGVPYNRDGTIGWEFFELAFDEGDVPRIVWRGPGPPSGHGYAAMGRDAGGAEVPLVCNDCHAAAWQNDGVLTPAFALQR